MNELLAQVIDAHGGMNRWNRYENKDSRSAEKDWRLMGSVHRSSMRGARGPAFSNASPRHAYKINQ
jgi:hypothetical protein